MRRSVLVTLAVGGMISGCGGGGSTAPSTAPPTASMTERPPQTEPEPPSEQRVPHTSSVTIVDFDYAPDPIEVAVGDSVAWSNQDSTSHTVSSRDGSLDSGVIASGASFTATFSVTGTFEYYCKFHPGSMVATVVVAPT